MEAAKINAENAGLSNLITFYNQDCTDLEKAKKVREKIKYGKGEDLPEI